jgi:hypothetical protein
VECAEGTVTGHPKSLGPSPIFPGVQWAALQSLFDYVANSRTNHMSVPSTSPENPKRSALAPSHEPEPSPATLRSRRPPCRAVS